MSDRLDRARRHMIRRRLEKIREALDALAHEPKQPLHRVDGEDAAET